MDEDLRLLATGSPAGFAHVVSGGKWKPFDHLLALDEMLLSLFNDEIDRLIVEIPVRHGKSELISQYTPPWWLGRNPEHQVILCGYEATFARKWGGRARTVMEANGEDVFGVKVEQGSKAADWWQLEGHKGQMRTAGAGGPITGIGADLLIIDDPIKNDEQANSKVYRDKTWDWWQGTVRTRLEPGAKVILAMARWHEDDLSGRLQAQENSKEKWTVLRLPAISEGPDAVRKDANEALCPEMYDIEELEKSKESVGSYFFNALYQQSPTSAEGNRFRRDDVRYYEFVGDDVVLHEDTKMEYVSVASLKTFQTCDVAASEKDLADYTVVSTWGITPNGRLLLLDSKRRKYELAKVTDFIKECNDDKERPSLYIETFGHGHGPYKVLTEDGYPVIKLTKELGSQSDKLVRSFKAVALCESHKVFFPRNSPVASDFIEEMVSFPNGAHDDQVDTLSYAAQIVPRYSVGGKRRRKPEQQTIMQGVMTERF